MVAWLGGTLAVLVVEQVIVTWCALWPLGPRAHELSRMGGWLQLYSFGASNLDVWLVTLAHAAATLALLAAARAPRRGGALGGGGAPDAGNLPSVELGCGAAGALAQLMLLAKAIAAAVLAPDGAWPRRPPDGTAGLACMYVSIAAGVVGAGAASLLARQQLAAWERRAAATAAGKAPAAARDEEAGLAEPLLPSKAPGAPKPPGGGSAAAAADSQSREAAARRRRGTIGQLLRMSVPDAPILLAAFTAGTAAALLAGLVPYYTGLIIDYASIDPDRRKFNATTLKLVAVAALAGLFTGVRGGLFSLTMTRLNIRLRRALFASLMQQESGFFDTNRTGEITSRLSADTTTVSDSLSLNINVFMRSATQAAVVLAFMFSASWRLTVVTFILVPIVLAVSKLYGAYYRRLAKKVQSSLAEANAVAEETLSSMPTVRAHAAQDGARAAYASKLDVYYGLLQREAAAYSAYAATTTFLPSCVAAAVLFYGGNLVLGGRMSPGALVSFMLYQQNLSSAFSMMGDVFSALTAAVGAADKVLELMNRQPELPPTGHLAPATLEGRLELRDVVFTYPARPRHTVLNGLSFTVNPGEVVALVGPSGGGKSSIIKLLQRFYVPQAGAVLIDGRCVGDYDQKWLRRHMALVSQEPVLFARSVRRNIMYGLEKEDGADAAPTQEEIEEAARQANAADFISSFPDGYDTECGEKGVALSGGQKQRVAIARALVRRPQVLLLDEATSALDADSEAVVQEALDNLMAGRTVLVVAHRLSTIRGADRIVVVQGGAVTEAGTHEELIAAGGAYSKLVSRQLHGAPSAASLSGLIGGGGSAGGSGARPGSSGSGSGAGAGAHGGGGGGGTAAVGDSFTRGDSFTTSGTGSQRASFDSVRHQRS